MILASIARLGVGVLLFSLLASCGPEGLPVHRRVYAAIGASDTVGVGAADPTTEGWVPRLYASMPRGTQLINLGVSGSTLRQAIGQQLPVALDARPDVVTVWLAVNDLKDGVPLSSYERDLDRLLHQLRTTGALVLVGNIPDLSQLPVPEWMLTGYGVPSRAALRDEIVRWNLAIAHVARRNACVLVDLYSEWQELRAHPEYVSLDGFHPSSAGYARLAQLWRQRLEATGFPLRER